MKINNFILAILALIHCSCSMPTNRSPTELSFNNENWHTDSPPSIGEITKAVNEKNVDEKLDGMKNWWLYGPGMGRTMLNIGTTIAFPPYALYLLTNAGLSVGGYETIKPTEVLPEKPKEVVNNVYDGITSVPGRINAYLGDKKFQDQLPTIGSK